MGDVKEETNDQNRFPLPFAQGKTPLDLAIKKKKKGVERVLRDFGLGDDDGTRCGGMRAKDFLSLSKWREMLMGGGRSVEVRTGGGWRLEAAENT